MHREVLNLLILTPSCGKGMQSKCTLVVKVHSHKLPQQKPAAMMKPHNLI